jgi:hypothetical protein
MICSTKMIRSVWFYWTGNNFKTNRSMIEEGVESTVVVWFDINLI